MFTTIWGMHCMGHISHARVSWPLIDGAEWSIPAVQAEYCLMPEVHDFQVWKRIEHDYEYWA